MQYVGLLISGYVLLAIESTLADGYGTVAWLLLPWLAVTLKPAPSIIAAGIYGLLLDCLSAGHPGVLVAPTVLATAGLRCMIQESSLSTGPRIAITSFMSALIMSSIIQFGLNWQDTGSIAVPAIAQTAASCGIGAISAAVLVSAARVPGLQRAAHSGG